MARMFSDLAWSTAKTAYIGGASYREASELSGISIATIRRKAIADGWVREGLPAYATPEARQAQTESARAAAAKRVLDERGSLAAKLLEDLLELREELFAPYVVKEAKVVPGPTGMGSDVEIVEIDLPHPVPADQQRIVTSMAILTEKVLLLTGEATSRTETLGEGSREAAEARLKMIRDELSERRSAKAEPAATGTDG